MSSVTCTLKLTVAGSDVTSTVVGSKVMLTSEGGVVSLMGAACTPFAD